VCFSTLYKLTESLLSPLRIGPYVRSTNQNNMINKFSYTLLLSVLVITPLFFLPFTPEDPFLLPKRAVSTLLACGIIIIVFFPADKLLTTLSSSLFLASLLLLTCFAVTIPYSTNYHEGFDELKRWACLLTLFLAASQIKWTRSVIMPLFIVCIGISCFISIYALMEYMELISFYPCELSKKRIYSFFGYHNILAQYLSITVLWGLGILVNTTSFKLKIITIPCIILSFLALFVTFCRGGMVSTVIGGIFFIIYYIVIKSKNLPLRKTGLIIAQKKKLIVLSVILSIIFLLPLAVFWNKFPVYHKKTVRRISSIISRKDNLRFVLWKDSLNMFRDAPIRGVGLGNYFIKYPLYKTGKWQWLTIDPHNELLHMATETGIVGLCGIGVFFVIITKRSLQNFRRRFTPEEKLLFLAPAAGCIATLSQSMVSYDLHSSASSVYFFIGLGMICSGESEETKTEPAFFTTLSKKILVIVPVVFVSLWGMYGEFKKFIGHYYYNTALHSLTQENPQECIAYSLKALRLQPYNSKYHRLISIAYEESGQQELAEQHYRKVLTLTPYHK